MIEYVATLVAYGLFVKTMRRKIILETIAILYIVIALILIYGVKDINPKTSRILESVIVCLICIRYFAFLT
jgi:hypothetical protein